MHVDHAGYDWVCAPKETLTWRFWNILLTLRHDLLQMSWLFHRNNANTILLKMMTSKVCREQQNGPKSPGMPKTWLGNSKTFVPNIPLLTRLCRGPWSPPMLHPAYRHHFSAFLDREALCCEDIYIYMDCLLKRRQGCNYIRHSRQSGIILGFTTL